MGTYLTEQAAIDAVDYQITQWRNSMESLIDQVDAPGITEPKAKAAFWLGLGLNAANHIFPEYTPQRIVNSEAGRLAAAGLKRVAMPVWVMSQVQSYFVDQYGKRLNRANHALFANHVHFRDKLVDQITGIARSFITTDYGRLIIRALMRHYQGHDFHDSVRMKAGPRELIEKAGLITGSRALLRQQIEPGLNSMMRKVELIARACPSSPARQQVFSSHRYRLLYSPSGDMEWVRWMNGPARTRYSDMVEITDPLEALKFMTGAYRMEVIAGTRYHPDTRPYAPFSTSLAQMHTVMVVQRYPHRSLSSFIPSFEQAEHEVMQALKTAHFSSSAA